MANVINRMKIMDGPSHITLHCFLQSDGASGELTNFVLFDPNDDANPGMPKQQDLIVKQVWYEMGGFSVIFSFNSLSPWPFWTLTPGASLHHDWRFFGGIKDYSSMPLFNDPDTPGVLTNILQTNGANIDPGTGGINSDGKLLISTRGFVDAADSGAFVLWLEKRDRKNPQPV